MALDHLQGVDGLERGGRREAEEQHAGLHLADVEPVAVVADDDVRLVEQVPQLLDDLPIVVHVTACVDAVDTVLAVPHPGDGGDGPLSLDGDDGAVHELGPHVGQERERLDVEVQDPGAGH